MALLNMVVPNDQIEENKEVAATSRLPADLIYEILTWVPSQSLQLNCKWVCKDWHNLITGDQTFIKLHQLRTPTIFTGFFLQRFVNTASNTQHATCILRTSSSPSSINNPSLTFNFLPLSLQTTSLIAASSKSTGLLCCTTTTTTDPCYYICKPSTKEWKRIPSPEMTSETFKISLEVIKTKPYLHFKLVRFSRSMMLHLNHNLCYHCEIFDSNSDQWKRLDDVRLPSSAVPRLDPCVVVEGKLYWFLWHVNKQENIFAYNIVVDDDDDNEGIRWKMIELPQEIIGRKRSGCKKKLFDFNGKLGLIYHVIGKFMEIWIMEDRMKEKWEKKCKVKFEYQDDQDFSCLRNCSPLDVYKDGTVLLKSIGVDQLVWFDYKRNSCEVLKIPPGVGDFIFSTQVFLFESDSIPVYSKS